MTETIITKISQLNKLKGTLSVDVPMPDDYAIIDISKRQARALLNYAVESGCVLECTKQPYQDSTEEWTHIRVERYDEERHGKS